MEAEVITPPVVASAEPVSGLDDPFIITEDQAAFVCQTIKQIAKKKDDEQQIHIEALLEACVQTHLYQYASEIQEDLSTIEAQMDEMIVVGEAIEQIHQHTEALEQNNETLKSQVD